MVVSKLSLVGPYTVMAPISDKGFVGYKEVVETRKSIDELLSPRDSSLVFDFGEIGMVNSGFLGLFVNFYRNRSVGKDICLKALNANEDIMEEFSGTYGSKIKINNYQSKQAIFSEYLKTSFAVSYKSNERSLPLFLSVGLQSLNPIVVLKKTLIPARQTITEDAVMKVKKDYFDQFLFHESLMYVSIVPVPNFKKVLEDRLSGKGLF
jgi:hypothetical protein